MSRPLSEDQVAIVTKHLSEVDQWGRPQLSHKTIAELAGCSTASVSDIHTGQYQARKEARQALQRRKLEAKAAQVPEPEGPFVVVPPRPPLMVSRAADFATAVDNAWVPEWGALTETEEAQVEAAQAWAHEPPSRPLADVLQSAIQDYALEILAESLTTGVVTLDQVLTVLAQHERGKNA